MIDVKLRTCESPGCHVKPVFNTRGLTKARFCARHKEDGMIDIKSPTCENAECGSQPAFTTRGSKQPRFCARHKEDGMIDIKHPTCETADCGSRPVFNTRGSKKARFCARHKEEGMIDIKSPICKNAKCDVNPVFNTRGSTKGRFCARHKEEGMIDIKSPMCENAECDVTPVFNKRGSTKGRFCARHKEDGMIDVKSLSCENIECDTRARFGFPGKQPHLCTSHRAIGTILQPRKRCLEGNCSELAVYGMRVHEHCEAHKVNGEVNILERKCKSCGLLGILDRNDNCETCDPATFKRIALAKQNMVRDYLIAEGFVFETVDRIIDGGVCGKERPDFYIDCGTHILIIEVDEHQHSGRACECEQTRMVNISQSNGMRTIFLRWNPDPYKPSRKGVPMMATSRRLVVLKEWVRHHLKTPPSEFLSVMYLFFDGYEYGDEKLEVMLACE